MSFKKPTSEQIEGNKAVIKKLFEARGVTLDDKALDAMSCTVSHLNNNYKGLVNRRRISDASTFTYKTEKRAYTLAEIYLNRILNNVKSVEIVSSGAKGEYVCADKKVMFNPAKIARQIKSWDFRMMRDADIALLATKNKAKIDENLQRKIYIHEFTHASGDDYDSVLSPQYNGGFYCHSLAGRYASRLEEIMAEKMALDVTGQKIPYFQFQPLNTSYLVGYNPESSNFNISSFIEIIPRVVGEKDFVKGYLSNPTEYIQDLNERFGIIESKTFATWLNDKLHDIAEDTSPLVVGKVMELQKFFFDEYDKTLEEKVIPMGGLVPEEFLQSIKDVEIFKSLSASFLYKDQTPFMDSPHKKSLLKIAQHQEAIFEKYKAYVPSWQGKTYHDLVSQAKAEIKSEICDSFVEAPTEKTLQK